jgi:rare lipoprotein A
MRPSSSRARAGLGLGALALATAGGATTVADAQQAAPAPAPAATAPAAPVATAAVEPAKRAASLRVTSRRLNVRTGRSARVGGRLTPAAPGRTVTLERRGARGWKTIDKARTSRTGRFQLVFKTRQVDTAQVRVRFSGDKVVRGKSRRIGRLNVFRPALASWYGPGLYGGHLACGGRLNAGTIGVAHKSLPCGTKLVLRKGSRIVRATVIDRGPYVGAREFDLTAATKARLGFGSTGTILVAH